MGMNAIEKILANHSEQDSVRPGDVVMVDVDVTVQFDSCRADVLRIANPDKLVLLHDHVVPAPTVQAANNAKRMREFVERFGITNYFPVGKHGISHVLVAAEGYALPGQILVNADSHTCSSGAMNCLARGMGPSEMLYILCKGQTWYLVGPTTKVVLEGSCPSGCTPATSSTTSPASTATSPAATSSGTATASRASASTAASRWRRSPPSCRPSSRCSRTTTCSPSTSRAGPSGRSSRRTPTTTPSTTR